MNLMLRGGRLLDPSQNLDDAQDLLIRDGLVAEIGCGLDAAGVEVVDVTGLVVTPGLIDVHVHLREPGQEHKETIATGSAAAVAGGFTSVLCMPNTEPAIHDRGVVEHVLNAAAEADLCRVLPMGAVSIDLEHQQMTEMADLVDAGCVALSDDGKGIQDSLFLRRVMDYARMFGVRLALHCEDVSLVNGGCMNEGRESSRLGLRGMPREAEEIHIARALILGRATGCPVHICHVSTAYGVELIRRAKEDGVDATAEACPHHFTLTDQAVDGYDTNAKMSPPLRTEADVEAVLEGVAGGVLDCIASDHAPHALHEKEVEFDHAAFGIVGLETELPLALTRLVHTGKMSLAAMVASLTCRPAAAFRLPTGSLRVGAPADVTVFDPDVSWTIDVTRFRSLSKNSPFNGCEVQGRVEKTIVGGRVVYDRQAAGEP